MTWINVFSSTEHAYHRHVSVSVGIAICDVCKKKTDVAEIDTSDGEYLSFVCCAPCFQDLIIKGKK
jgi:hypothetical protein